MNDPHVSPPPTPPCVETSSQWNGLNSKGRSIIREIIKDIAINFHAAKISVPWMDLHLVMIGSKYCRPSTKIWKHLLRQLVRVEVHSENDPRFNPNPKSPSWWILLDSPKKNQSRLDWTNWSNLLLLLLLMKKTFHAANYSSYMCLSVYLAANCVCATGLASLIKYETIPAQWLAWHWVKYPPYILISVCKCRAAQSTHSQLLSFKSNTFADLLIFRV